MRLPLRWLRRTARADAEAILAAAREDDAEDFRAAQQRLLHQASRIRTTAPGSVLGPDTPTLGIPTTDSEEGRGPRNGGHWR